MSKVKTAFYCQNCGYQTPKWLGKCPSCTEWNTFVEEIVEKLTPVSGAVVIPSWVVSAVCHVRNGAHPSYASGYSERDNSFYKSWDDIAKDRESFEKWIEVHITGTTDFDSFSRSVGISALVSTNG